MPTVITPVIGTSLTQVWNTPPDLSPGDFDPFAPFQLGSLVDTTPDLDAAGLSSVAQFCRVTIEDGVADGAEVGIADGLADREAADGNTWVNRTGVDLAVGDYAFLIAAIPTYWTPAP